MDVTSGAHTLAALALACRTPGATLAVSPDKPYQALNHFGTGFLSRFEGSQCPARLLEEITLVDTPGACVWGGGGGCGMCACVHV